MTPSCDQLGAGAGEAHERRRAERHALDGDEPERLVPGGQQRQVERAHHLGHVVALAEEVHGWPDSELVDQVLELAQVARGCRSARPCR